MRKDAASIKKSDVVNGTETPEVHETGLPLAAVTVHWREVGNIPATERSLVVEIPMVACEVLAAPITVTRRFVAVQFCGTGMPAASLAWGLK